MSKEDLWHHWNPLLPAQISIKQGLDPMFMIYQEPPILCGDGTSSSPLDIGRIERELSKRIPDWTFSVSKYTHVDCENLRIVTRMKAEPEGFDTENTFTYVLESLEQYRSPKDDDSSFFEYLAHDILNGLRWNGFTVFPSGNYAEQYEMDSEGNLKSITQIHKSRLTPELTLSYHLRKKNT